ncbi:MAG: hypothetical protein LBU03_05630 [Tannerellaceae bacterium]|jgi:hypothetical protein|nr:hypothetical protein [Tannerellaceae bacterium]
MRSTFKVLFYKRIQAPNISIGVSELREAEQELSDPLSRLSTVKGVSYKTPYQPISTADLPPERITVVEQANSKRQAEAELVKYGFDVESLEKSFPELVSVNEDGSKAVDYAGLSVILLESIKQLSADVAAIKSVFSYSNGSIAIGKVPEPTPEEIAAREAEYQARKAAEKALAEAEAKAAAEKEKAEAEPATTEKVKAETSTAEFKVQVIKDLTVRLSAGKLTKEEAIAILNEVAPLYNLTEEDKKSILTAVFK